MKFSFGKNKIKNFINNSVLKKKDSLIGLPVLFTLSGFSNIRNAVKPDIVNKIAVLKITSVRDVIFTKDAVKALKQMYPNASVTYFAGEDNLSMASELEGVTNTVRLFSNDLSKSIKIVKNTGHFDLWIDFGVWSRFEAIMSQSARASYKIGFKTDGEHRHFAYDKVVEYSFDKHYTKNLEFLLSSIGVHYINNHEEESIERLDILRQVIIDIFADNQDQNNRKWSQNNWKTIVEYLNKQGYRVILVGNKKDIEEAEMFNELAGSNADIDFLVGRLDFEETVKLFKQSALIISGDTSLLHMAVYYNTPAIALYGPTDKSKYGPLGSNVYVVSSTGCSGCQSLYGDEKCSMNIPDCMDSISPNTVINYINTALGVNVEEK